MRILVADDEELERDALEMLIHRYDSGIEVIKAKNGREAVSSALADDVDLCILDIRMPLLDGIEAASAIKKARPGTGILFLTAWGEFTYAQKAVRLGASDYLVKPIGYETLKGALDRIAPMVGKGRVSISGSISREFFTMLKYGGMLCEVERIFDAFGVKDFSGTVFTSGSSDYKSLHALFPSGLGDGEIRACHYEDGDRCTFIVFPIGPEEVSGMLQDIGRDDFRAGIGIGFSSVSGIPAAIASSFSAYTQALQQKKAVVSAVQSGVDQAFDRAKVMRFADDMLEYTLSGKAAEARHSLNGILDAVRCGIRDVKEMQKELYGIAVVYRHNIQSKVPLFFYPEPEGLSAMELENYLSSFITEAVEAVLEDKKDKYKRVFSLISDYLARHYAENPGQEEVAGYIGIQPSYFSRLFKEYYGINFSVYMQNLKMDKAKSMLLEGKSVKEVADATGFSDPNYFSRVFHSHFGTPPKNFKG